MLGLNAAHPVSLYNNIPVIISLAGLPSVVSLIGEGALNRPMGFQHLVQPNLKHENNKEHWK